MSLITIEADQKIKNAGALPQSFYLKVPNVRYGKLHVSSLGGNCKMCTISDVGNVTYGVGDREALKHVVARINELFTVYSKLVFQVNISTYDLMKGLAQNFELIDVRCLPIGYKDRDERNSKITYIGTFFAKKSFSSNGVDQIEVRDRYKDKALRKIMRRQERNLMKIKKTIN